MTILRADPTLFSDAAPAAGLAPHEAAATYVDGGVDIRHEAAIDTAWVTMRPRLGHALNYSPAMLDAFDTAFGRWEANGCQWEAEGGSLLPVHYAVLQSGHPEYFNVGGDLALFNACIARGDFDGLRAYSLRCMDLTYRWACHVSERATTISLVQGRALGGGFESALSSDYVIAEEQAEFGLPEILFGLFPCSGAMPLLARRIGLCRAERLMTNGRVYTASELLDMGVIDEVCPRGGGRQAVRRFIAEHAKVRQARQAVQQARRRMQPLDLREMAAVVDDWVELARSLSPASLRVLDTLTRMQRADFAH
ncbi:MAG: enoyl-CoA hydratase/isomerase family protein [Betaproteobacteria bacterium]|nr:enoyl-CoA hydratase/isomerase family protein [Betaproteobacteria bacterium]